jgi:hypothetical protein
MIDICKNFVKYILIKRNYRFIGTKKQRNKGTKKELCKINYIKNKQYIIYDKSI